MANTYLTRTPSSGGTPTTQRFTLSFWIKKCATGINQRFFGVYTSANLNTNMKFNSNDTFQFYNRNTSTGDKYFVTNRQFRDTNAWYHFVIAIDTTLSTEADRVKFYVNGVEETSFSENFEPPQNYEYRLGEAIETRIGIMDSSSDYLNGALSHFHYIDGTQYSATAFGQYDANGVWKIKTSPSVTYGTNGFFILKNGNSVTDQSGNSNNFTVGGGTLTNTEDSPSNVFATGNPLDQNGGMTFSEGNLTFASTSASWRSTKGTLGMTAGKYYWEVKVINTSGSLLDMNVGVIDFSLASQSEYSTANPALAYNAGDGSKSFNGSNSSYGSSYTVGDIIGVAFDADNLTVEFFKNGTSQGVVNTGWSSGITWTPVIAVYGRYNNTKASANFGNGYFGTTAVSSAGTNASGNGIFEYDVPTGFTALSTKGLNL